MRRVDIVLRTTSTALGEHTSAICEPVLHRVCIASCACSGCWSSFIVRIIFSPKTFIWILQVEVSIHVLPQGKVGRSGSSLKQLNDTIDDKGTFILLPHICDDENQSVTQDATSQSPRFPSRLTTSPQRSSYRKETEDLWPIKNLAFHAGRRAASTTNRLVKKHRSTLRCSLFIKTVPLWGMCVPPSLPYPRATTYHFASRLLGLIERSPDGFACTAPVSYTINFQSYLGFLV